MRAESGTRDRATVGCERLQLQVDVGRRGSGDIAAITAHLPALRILMPVVYVAGCGVDKLLIREFEITEVYS